MFPLEATSEPTSGVSPEAVGDVKQAQNNQLPAKNVSVLLPETTGKDNKELRANTQLTPLRPLCVWTCRTRDLIDYYPYVHTHVENNTIHSNFSQSQVKT